MNSYAKNLGFYHPRNKKFINFESSLPNDFKKMLNLLEKLSETEKSIHTTHINI